MRQHSGFSVQQVTFLAMAAVLNIIGGNLALAFRLPVYLDTLGTFLSAMLFGPVCGMIPGLLSGLLTGITTDVYSLYYIPVQLVTGFTAGILFGGAFRRRGKRFYPLYAAAVTLPGTVVSSLITVFLFGGITSSGSSLIVQALRHLGMSLTAAVFCVQFITDYADRVIMLLMSAFVLNVLPASMLAFLKKGNRTDGTLQ